MNSQKRRIVTDTDAGGIGAVDLTLDLDDADAVNVHGMRFCASIEPENTDANANGFWAVWCLPSGVIQTADLPISLSALGNETDGAAYLWGVGCWTASNQAPYHFEFAPKTSRNCQKGARLIFRIKKDGVSAGNVRINALMTGFTTS